MKTRLKNFRKKIFTKGRRVLSKIVPINKRYQPVGIINISQDAKSDSLEYIEIASAYTSKLQLDQSFIDACSPYAKPKMTIEVPGDYIVALKNGRVYSHDAANMAVITQDNLLVEEVSFQWSNDVVRTATHNILFKERLFNAPKKIKGNVFSLLAGGGAITYYYHWVLDAIPKISLLKSAGLFDTIDFFLVPNYIYKFQKEYLDHFGIPASKIINAEVTPHIQADTLYVASYVRIDDHHPKWVCDFLYQSFITADKKDRSRDKLIYIARGDAALNRKVINEKEVIEMLRLYGFEVHYLSGLTVIEQAKLFNSARIVVGAHGAGLTNIVFCEPGSKVLEFFPDNYVRHLFYDLANKRGVEYHHLLCASDGAADNSSDGQKLSLITDVPAMKLKIESLLAKN